MVLSLHRTMPPKRYPRALEEKMAAIADQLAKLVDSMSSSNTKIEIMLKNITTNTARLETITKQLTSQTITTTNLVANYTNINMEVTTPTPSPSLPPPTSNLDHKLPTMQEEIVISPTTKLHQTFDLADLIEDKITPERVRFLPSHPPAPLSSPPNEPIALPLQRLSANEIQANCIRGPCFRCSESFQSGPQCKPPKFVFLPSELIPPWESHDPSYKNVSLEDKARVEAGSIDTYFKPIMHMQNGKPKIWSPRLHVSRVSCKFED